MTSPFLDHDPDGSLWTAAQGHLPPPAPKPERSRSWIMAAFAAGGLACGIGIGAVATPAPDAQVQTVTQAKTPQACLDAIEQARAGFRVAATFALTTKTIFDAVPDFMNAVLYRNADGIDRFSNVLTEARSTMSQNNDDLDKNTFVSDAAACEAAG